MKAAIRYLEEYAEEIENEGFKTRADSIREAISELRNGRKSAESTVQVEEVPEIIPGSTGVRWKGSVWIPVERLTMALESVAAAEQEARDLREKVKAMDSLIKSQITDKYKTEVKSYYRPETMGRVHSVRVDVNESLVSWAKINSEEVFNHIAQEIVVKLADQFKKIGQHVPRYK